MEADWALERTFAWLSLGDGRAYLIPLDAQRLGLQALQLYRSQTLRASCVKTLFALGLKLGSTRDKLPRVHFIVRRSVDGGAGAVDIFQYVRQVLRRDDLSFGISAGTPGPDRKPVLLVLGANGETIAYVKVGSSRRSNTLVRREAETLRFLSGRVYDSFWVPAVLHSGSWNQHFVLIQSAPSQTVRASGRAQRMRYLDVPKELARLHHQWVPLGESDFCKDIQLCARQISHRDCRRLLEHAIRKAHAHLKDQTLPFHFSHGDYTPWNVYTDGDRLYVFDWECSRQTGLPAEDVFHFHFQEMSCVQRRAIEKIYAAFLRNSPVRERVLAHLASLGVVRMSVEWLFMLYRVEELARQAAGSHVHVDVLHELPVFRQLVEVL